MILHHKQRLNDVSFYIKSPLHYSNSFTFIPIHYKYKGKITNVVFQTPQLFIPYGIKELSNKKLILDLSFQNHENDIHVSNFVEDLEIIYMRFFKKYADLYKVHHFLRETIFYKCMRCKVDSSTLLFNQSKQKINTINPFTYSRFLLQLSGLWIIDNEVWFQWNILQGQIESPLTFTSFCFIDDETSTTTSSQELSKYEKMIKMGVPKEAVEKQKQLDSNNIPPPPPPPPFISSKTSLSNTRISQSRIDITSSDLLSVKLKKTETIPLKQKPRQRTGFEPPSKEELQIAISKLQKINN